MNESVRQEVKEWNDILPNDMTSVNKASIISMVREIDEGEAYGIIAELEANEKAMALKNSKMNLNQPKRAKNPHYKRLTDKGYSLEVAYSSPYQSDKSNLLLIKDGELIDSVIFKNNRQAHYRIKSLLESSYEGSHKSDAMEHFVNNLDGGIYD